MFSVGVEEHRTALIPDCFSSSVVDVSGDMYPNARMTMIVVIPSEESATVGPSVLETAELVGEVRPVNGHTWGRLSDLVTPRSANRWATGWAIIGDPRSECKVSWSFGTSCFSMVSLISRLESSARSTRASIHPTTYRLKMSKMT